MEDDTAVEEGEVSGPWEEMEAARHAFSSPLEVVDTHFGDSLLGGNWQQARTGRAVYGRRSDVRATSAISTFCVTFPAVLSKMYMGQIQATG